MNPGNPAEPLRILAITMAHLFPNQARPTAGIFFANLLRRLMPLVERLAIVVPTAYIPGFLQRLPRFSFRRKIARHERWHGLEVFRPSYLSNRSTGPPPPPRRPASEPPAGAACSDGEWTLSVPIL